jgi:CheY-like chemotaxis protein
MRILLADDQKEIRLLTTVQLERCGHHVVAVANGQEALGALQRESFDVILMDEEMPVMNGPQALSAIREREKDHGRMVLIALTGNDTAQDRERLLRAGFDSVIRKPFRLEALDATLRSSLESALSGALEHGEGAAPHATFDDLAQRVGGDEKLLRRMIQTFLREIPKRLSGIQQAIQQKRGENLTFLAHALKGSVSIFAANRACQHCQELQELGRNSNFSEASRVYESLREEIAELEANLRGYARQKSSPSSGVSPKAKRRSASPKQKAP